MKQLKRLYASSGEEVIIETLEISVGDQHYWITKGWDNVAATLEDGTQVIFEACGIDVALPAKNKDGTQDLKFAISNVTGLVSTIIREAIKQRQVSTITYRQYISTDLSAPSERPTKMSIKSGSWTPAVANITAGFMNIMDKSWPRHRFTLPEYPGLRHI